MSKIKDMFIEVRDYYGDECLIDKVNTNNISTQRRPRGEVFIYEQDDNNNKNLVHKKNLVVYPGREMLAQRLVNINNTFMSVPTKDEFVNWFGLGDGGVRSADPLTPVPPINNDEYLYSPIPISNIIGSVYADYHNIGETAPSGGVYASSGSYVKQFDGVEFEADALNDNKQLIIKITTTVGVNDANGYQLSEAGLFSAESSVGNYSGNFTLFARVTFPSISKSTDRRLIFVWYLYV